MDLYLIRHAEAKPLGADGITRDEDRPLTEAGEAQARELAAGLQRHGVHLGLLLTSPLLRARQTAEAILRQWSLPAPELRVCAELAPGVKPKKLARLLRILSADGVGLVGHMPDLARHTAWLIGGKKAQIDLAKAGAAHLVCPDFPRKGSCTLIWLVTPELLRR
ncbi:MAG TPA: phosphohistidine phosphatase SixA [Gemmataceae bacterium]|nr:phosphohistidine phosphatase SixA [Gemmataceae bacterium]